MLKYELTERTQETVTYKYFPEGKDTFGTICVRQSNGEIVEERLADCEESQWYHRKMLRRIQEFVNSNNFKMQGVVAWY